MQYRRHRNTLDCLWMESHRLRPHRDLRLNRGRCFRGHQRSGGKLQKAGPLNYHFPTKGGMKMDRETLIRIAEELHQGAFDAKAYYLIMQQYRKNQRNYAEEMKVSPAFYHTVYDALMKACFMEIAKLYDSSNSVVSIGTLLAKCEENQDLFPKYRETLTVDHDGTTFPTRSHISTNSSHKRNASLEPG